MHQIGVVGLSYRHAGVDDVARFTVPKAEVAGRLPALRDSLGVAEIFYVATCNRVEVVYATADGAPAADARDGVFRALIGREPRAGEATRLFRAWTGEAAIEHLFLVACGLDSAQAGEQEIAAQIRLAWATARGAQVCGAILDRLLGEALSMANKVRRLASNVRSPSLADLAADRVVRHVEGKPARVALVGVSPMTRRCGMILHGAAIPLLVVNRTLQAAEEFAETVGGEAISLEKFREDPTELGALVLAAGGGEPVLGRQALMNIAAAARARAPLLVDLGVPPNADPEATRGAGIARIGMDELIQAAQERRLAQLMRLAPVRAAIDERLTRLRSELATRAIGRQLAHLRGTFEQIAAEEADRALAGELRDLDQNQRECLQRFASTVARRLAHLPLAGLRAAAEHASTDAVDAFFREARLRRPGPIVNGKKWPSALFRPSPALPAAQGFDPLVSPFAAYADRGVASLTKHPRSEELYERACRVIPGGVNSPVRAFKAVGGTPLFIERGSGQHLVDADGRTYLDLVGSWGALILGHSHPAVVSAIAEASTKGTTFGAPCAAEVELAERIVASYPGLEQVRFVSSGTEAVMSAIRVARAFTSRDLIVKFSGCYHGHADHLLVAAGSGLATFGTPSSAGVPEAFTACTRVLPLDDEAAVEELFTREGTHIAAVIIEPVPANHGLLLQRHGFLQKLRELTRRAGALLIFDEVISGFRLARGGVAELVGIVPDMATFGKVIGGGMPVGAFGGRREIMQRLAPLGDTYQAGTLSGNPVAMAAGLTTLDILIKQSGWDGLEQIGAQVERSLGPVLSDAAFPIHFVRAGSLFWMSFHDAAAPRAAASMSAKALQRYSGLFHAMLDRGVYLPPSAYEACFLSLAHTAADIEQLTGALRESLATIQ